MIWEKYGYFWLRKSPRPDSGVSDIIFNTCTKIIMDNDVSEFALNAFCYCLVLLRNKKRWPSEFGKIYNGRRQSDMTRDPYIAFASLYTYLINNDFPLKNRFSEIKLPWYLRTPRFWLWWRRLKKDNRKHYKKRLSYFIALAVKNNFEKKYQDDFYEEPD